MGGGNKRKLPSVGASLLAKNVNDKACFLNERGACESFASKLNWPNDFGHFNRAL